MDEFEKKVKDESKRLKKEMKKDLEKGEEILKDVSEKIEEGFKESEKQIKSGEWYNNPSIITNITIVISFLIIILSQAFAVKNNLATNAILRNLLNHNSIYLLGLVYLIPLKTKFGKKYFYYFNVFFIIVYIIYTTTSLLTVIQSFSLPSIISFCINAVFLVYIIHSLVKDTKVWNEFKLKRSPFNEISNDSYFYVIVVLSVILLSINLIEASTFDGVFISLLEMCYYIFLTRFVTLYNKQKDKSKKGSMFAEIKENYKDLPKFKTIANKVGSLKMNNYQKLSIITFAIFFVIGIIFGNIFPSCRSASGLYNSICTSTEFNFSLTLLIWFISFLICVFFYGLGEIISILNEVNKKLTKK